MREVVIVAGVRTPIGNFGGALKDLPPHKMGNWSCVKPSRVPRWIPGSSTK